MGKKLVNRVTWFLSRYYLGDSELLISSVTVSRNRGNRVSELLMITIIKTILRSGDHDRARRSCLVEEERGSLMIYL